MVYRTIMYITNWKGLEKKQSSVSKCSWSIITKKLSKSNHRCLPREFNWVLPECGLSLPAEWYSIILLINKSRNWNEDSCYLLIKYAVLLYVQNLIHIDIFCRLQWLRYTEDSSTQSQARISFSLSLSGHEAFLCFCMKIKERWYLFDLIRKILERIWQITSNRYHLSLLWKVV
jgi:hypothetical protein